MTYFEFIPITVIILMGLMMAFTWRVMTANVKNQQEKITAAEDRIIEKVETHAQHQAEDRDFHNVQIGKMHEQLQPLTNLEKVLSNDSKRGRLGEMAAENLLLQSGLRKNTDFVTQKMMLGEGKTKLPDITIFLPEGKTVSMDVKFPLSNYQKMIDADDKDDSENYSKTFLNDVKDHVKRLSGKEYRNENTVDFVIMYIPLVTLYDYILENDQDLCEWAIKKKVVICSQNSLIPMLNIIQTSLKSFGIIEKQEEFLKRASKVYKQDQMMTEALTSIEKFHEKAIEKINFIKNTRLRLYNESIKDLLVLSESSEDPVEKTQSENIKE